MKILVLIPDAFGGRGGIAKFNSDFLTALCTYPNSKEVIAIPRKVVDLINLLPNKLNYIVAGSKGKLSFIIAILQTLKYNTKFDLIICGHINFIPLAYLIHVWTKAPFYLILHGYEAWQPSPSWLVNNLLKKVNGIICVSELTKQRFLRWTKLENIQEFILPNTVNLEGFTPGVKNHELIKRYKLESKTIIMTLGRLDSSERYKGFDEVLNVLPNLISEIPNLVYMIVGEGCDRERLEAKVKSLDIEQHVVFTGFIQEPEKADHYRLADAYVMPSKGEGFGIVYLEAMACGIPTVASKVDGSREAVRNGLLGILVNPDDPEEIKAGIIEALKRPKGIVPEGLDYFSDENFERRCHNIIHQIMKLNTNI
jgi:phosphatidyl-myo-inositol dimannoside synthase